VRNTALNVLKHTRAESRWETAYEQAEVPPGMGTPELDIEDAFVRSELAVALRRALERLPERRQQILLLRLQQLTYGEIAEVMDISPKTVEAQITQAFAALRVALGKWVE
jgi:RNA polymerase sigma-70 factor (ECF subfamily)